VSTAIDCPPVSPELARRNVNYARSAAARAEMLWREGAILRDEFLRRTALLSRAEQCLEKQATRVHEDRVVLLDDEQIGID